MSILGCFVKRGGIIAILFEYEFFELIFAPFFNRHSTIPT